MLAPAKVNLSLFLGGTRVADGRHELVTVFQSLAFGDRVEFLPSSVDSVVCPGVSGPNLAAGALAALRSAGWDGPPALVRIDKRIPVAAGMAGGSADAAAVLRWSGLPVPALESIGAALGADVAAQVLPGLSLGTGAGEVVTRFTPLGEHAYVVVPSASALSTAAVYREADRLGVRRLDSELAELESEVRDALVAGGRFPAELIINDLEPAALSLCPAIADVLEAVAECGADHTLVSGSGPTVVGIWWGAGASGRAEAAANALSPRFGGAFSTLPFAGLSQLGPSQ